MTFWQVVQDFRHSHKSILITVSSNNIKLGARGFKGRPLKVVQDFFHQQHWNFMCLGEELQRISGQKLKDVLAICIHYLVRSLIFELKVTKPGAFRFDYIATQAGQSSARMPENGCRTRRREEAESFSKKQAKVTSVAWQPHATLTRYTTRSTAPYTARNTSELLAGAAFWSFEAFKEWNENTSQLFLSWPEMRPLAAFR